MMSQNGYLPEGKLAPNGKKQVSILGLLHWAFQRECAGVSFDRYQDDDHLPPNFGMEYIMIEQAKLGCRVDGGGVSSDPHEDAMALVDALAVLPEGCGGRRMAIWIAELARAGATPDWMAEANPTCKPIAWKHHKHGRFAVREFYTGTGRWPTPWLGKEWGYCCPVTYNNTAQEVAAARRAYLGWWGALFELRATFQIYGNLTEHVVTDGMPPLHPWR